MTIVLFFFSKSSEEMCCLTLGDKLAHNNIGYDTNKSSKLIGSVPRCKSTDRRHSLCIS